MSVIEISLGRITILIAWVEVKIVGIGCFTWNLTLTVHLPCNAAPSRLACCMAGSISSRSFSGHPQCAASPEVCPSVCVCVCVYDHLHCCHCYYVCNIAPLFALPTAYLWWKLEKWLREEYSPSHADRHKMRQILHSAANSYVNFVYFFLWFFKKFIAFFLTLFDMRAYI